MSRANHLESYKKRLASFERMHAQRFGRSFSGRMLEFGCGAGGFMVSALKNGMDIHGVEVDVERQKQFMRNAEEFHPEAANRFTLYDGRLLPFPSHHFDGC